MRSEISNVRIPAEHINPELLPRLLRELAEVIGLSATLALAEAYPGVAVYIPSQPHPDHPLAKLIGYQNLQRLAAAYGQDHLRMPKLDAAIRQIKHRLVRDLKARQHSNRAIALQVGYTTRRIEQLNSEHAADGEQEDLFSSPKKSASVPATSTKTRLVR